ncbi:branched-chain amino acid ABC transporter permease [Defluviitalea raffinosedens]|uniref:branched-chain amino acid ABC transporter permease n=1 Tax=Defluviitalea raffinosedens TaxID=1450156 RepID=UPI00195E8320|nr:branched-chain amino acid ABC transporter permease [Defluviitalea raffinosedens]MBM7686571.1 branched-chain amino acid transport system permease protein [Defluviitalea raffinosedens]
MKTSKKVIYSLILAVITLAFLFLLESNKAKYGMAYTVLTKGIILAVVAVSMNLVTGFTGLFSLGQAGFMAIGAYVTAIFLIPMNSIEEVYYMSGVSPSILALKSWLETTPSWFQAMLPYIALIAGGLVAALFAALIGIPVLRLKSDYLAIATLGFSEIIRAIISSPQMDTITNGSYGLKKIQGFSSLIQVFLIAAVCIAFMILLIRSTYGRAFKAIREDEIAAEAMGINLFKHKSMSFIIGSFFAAVSGGMLAMFMRSIDAKTFTVSLTYDILLIVVIGGIGSVTGSILSSILVTVCKEWWLRFFDNPLYIGNFQVPLFRTGFRMVIFSVVLLLVVLFYQRGLMGRNEFSWDRFAKSINKLRSKSSSKGGSKIA